MVMLCLVVQEAWFGIEQVGGDPEGRSVQGVRGLEVGLALLYCSDRKSFLPSILSITAHRGILL